MRIAVEVPPAVALGMGCAPVAPYVTPATPRSCEPGAALSDTVTSLLFHPPAFGSGDSATEVFGGGAVMGVRITDCQPAPCPMPWQRICPRPLMARASLSLQGESAGTRRLRS